MEKFKDTAVFDGPSCPVCYLTKERMRKLECGHMICDSCQANMDSSGLKKSCPLCRGPLETLSFQRFKPIKMTRIEWDGK